MVYVDTDSDDGSWAGYVADMENINKLRVTTSKPSFLELEQTILNLEQKLQKAEKKIRKLEQANKLLAELAV